VSQTTDRRRKAVAEDARRQADRQYRKDVGHLLQDPAFQRFMAVEWFGHLGFGSDPCRSSAYEAQRAAARIGVAVEQRRRLLQFDHTGVQAIDAAHHATVAIELELLDTIQDEPATEEEQTDE
jgi:hypothetical protein